MRDSIARKVVTAAAFLAAPPAVLIFLFVADSRVRMLSIAGVVPGAIADAPN